MRFIYLGLLIVSSCTTHALIKQPVHELELAIKNDDIHALQQLFNDYSINPNQFFTQGECAHYSLLQVACYKKSFKTAQFLLEMKAAVSVNDICKVSDFKDQIERKKRNLEALHAEGIEVKELIEVREMAENYDNLYQLMHERFNAK